MSLNLSLKEFIKCQSYGQSSAQRVKVLLLNAVNLGLILGIQYGPKTHKGIQSQSKP